MRLRHRTVWAQFAWVTGALLVVLSVTGCGDSEPVREFFSVWQRTSADNASIAFTTLGGGGQYLVYRIGTGGGGSVLLTKQSNDGNPNNDIGFHPFFSPDGSTVVFVSADDGNNDIFTMDRNGSDRTQITSHSGNDTQPSFSPDGSKIVFVSNRSGATNDIWMMDPDGIGLQQLTNLPGDAEWPSLGPGSGGTVDYRLTFQYSNPPGSPTDIYTANVQVGGGFASVLVNITNTAGISEGAPSWDPTGTGAATDEILYHSDFGGEFAIYKMQADGTSVALDPEMNSSFSQGFPVWYPDGTRFTFTQAREVWHAARDGSDTRRVTTRFPS